MCLRPRAVRRGLSKGPMSTIKDGAQVSVSEPENYALIGDGHSKIDLLCVRMPPSAAQHLGKEFT